MILAFALFLFIFYSIVALSHLVVFFVIRTIFSLSPELNIFGWIFSLGMPLMLIFVAMLSRQFDGSFLRAIYSSVMIWHGALVNFLLASILLLAIYYLNKIIGASFNLPIIFYGLFAAAIIVSVAGIFNAINPRLKELSIEIKNLPAEWDKQTVMQISDVHLGNLHQHKFLNQIISEINAVKPKILFITGDLFDGSYPDDYRLLEEFKNLDNDIQIFFVNGNHETYHKGKFLLPEYTNAPAQLLENLILDYKGLKIIGLDYSKPDLALLDNLNATDASILLYHEPKYITEAKAAGIKLQLAGHTHYGQQWPFNYITKMIYGRYHNGLTVEGDYNIYTTNGTGTWGPPMRIGNKPEIVKITLIKK